MVALVLVFGIATSIVPRQVETITLRITQLVTVRETVTITQAMPTQTVFTGKQLVARLGEAFVIEMDKQPVEVTFTRLHFESSISYSKAGPGYKFAVIDLKYRSLGNVEARVYWANWKDPELKVSTGYSYKVYLFAGIDYKLSVKPGEVVAGYMCFEIPVDASPIEVRITPDELSAKYLGTPEVILKLA